MVWKTLSPKCVSICADTCCCNVTRVSNMTLSKPMSCSSGLMLRCTLLMVLTRSESPSSAKYSHCMGMMTPCADARPFKVRRDQVGGQESDRLRGGKGWEEQVRFG